MKSKSLISFLVTGAALAAVALSGGGCVKSSLSLCLEQLKSDPALVSANVSTPWGTVTVTRSGGAYAGQPVSVQGGGISVGNAAAASTPAPVPSTNPSIQQSTNPPAAVPPAIVTAPSTITAPATVTVSVPSTANVRVAEPAAVQQPPNPAAVPPPSPPVPTPAK